MLGPAVEDAMMDVYIDPVSMDFRISKVFPTCTMIAFRWRTVTLADTQALKLISIDYNLDDNNHRTCGLAKSVALFVDMVKKNRLFVPEAPSKKE